MQKHILVISQYFDPEPFRINDLCEEWVKRGYRVTVLTGKPNYPTGKYYSGYGFFKKRKEQLRGAQIIRLPIIPRGNNFIMLALNYFSFFFYGFFWSLFTRTKADIVFVYQLSPIIQAIPGITYAKKRKIPCYLYVMDLWPESFSVITKTKCKFIVKWLERIVHFIYKKCDKIFLSSKSFSASVESHGADRTKLVYWPQYAEDFYCPIALTEVDIPELLSEQPFIILFAGNIGQAQGLGVLPAAAEILRQKGCSIRFRIIGDGSYKKKLQKRVNELGVNDYFQFIERQPAEKIPYFMAKSDASLVCLAKSDIFALTLPAKVQSSMACGKPIIVCADGEAGRIVLEAGAGVCANAEDAAALAEQIQRLTNVEPEKLKQMGQNARRYYEQHFSKKKLLDEMEYYLNS